MPNILETLFRISPDELPRIGYAWILRFLLRVSIIIGFTGALAMVVARYSIEFMPVLILIQAMFSVVGMLLFSVIVDKLEGRHLIIMATIFAIVTLLIAAAFWDNDLIFFTMVLVANGLFLQQVGIIFSNYLEDFFTPLEADRQFPLIDTSETIGGIAAGVVLAVFGINLLGANLVILWAILLSAFLVIFISVKPATPYYLTHIVKETKKSHRVGVSWNSVMKSVNEIKRVPFLQILLTVLLLHWTLSHLVEFIFTRAVDESVHAASMGEHEALLTEGLGRFHIFIHSVGMVVEFFVVSRLIRSLGTFAGFVFHGIVTFLGSVAVMLGLHSFTAYLLRLNFETTSIMQRHSYETAYYAFRYGTQRSLREFFEGIILPAGTIIGTLSVIGVQTFFAADHVLIVLPAFMILLTLLMSFFALQMKKHYTGTALYAFQSGVPYAQYHAIEILAQKGHKNSYNVLTKIYNDPDTNPQLMPQVVGSIALLRDKRAVPLFLNIVGNKELEELHVPALTGLRLVHGKLRDAKEDSIIDFLTAVVNSKRPFNIRENAMRTLAEYDKGALIKFFQMKDDVLRTIACAVMAEKVKYRGIVKDYIRQLIEKDDHLSGELLAHLTCRTRYANKLLKKYWTRTIAEDDQRKMTAYFGLAEMGDSEAVSQFLDLLLGGNKVSFKKGLEMLASANLRLKKNIVLRFKELNILSYEIYKDKEDLMERINEICKICEAHEIHPHVSEMLQNFALEPVKITK